MTRYSQIWIDKKVYFILISLYYCTLDKRTEKWVNFTPYFPIFEVQKLLFTT